ncbi:MAG: hypothetical protein MJZ11_01485 [Lachnospiraceae bacterium]|nr:hypothetical protein [Lachnospiraceae bacterium]
MVSKKLAGGIAVAIIVVFVIANSFTIIPTGYTGVRSTFGQISSEVVPNGFNWKIPFVQNIQRVNNKQQDISFEEVISAETSERNEVYFSGVTVTYQINAEKSAWIFANVSDYQNNLVSNALVASALKTSSKTLAPVDVTNRNTLEPLVKENIQKSLNEKYGSEVVRINKVVINNATFDDEYNNKIAQKQQAQMAYETQQIENKTSVEKAEAEAKVKLTQAQADADALKISAQAEAEANKVLEESLTDVILKQMYLEKWDGQLPMVTSDNNMMLDISSFNKVKSTNMPSNTANNTDSDNE